MTTASAALIGLIASLGLAAEPLSLEETVALKRVSAVGMSPTGGAVAYTLSVPREPYQDEDGEAWSELHVINGAEPGSDARPFVTGEVQVKDFAWAADGESLFFTARRDPEADFVSLWQIARDGGEAVQRHVHVNNIGSIHPSPDGGKLAFVAADAPPAKEEELEEKGFRAIVYEESVPVQRVWLLDLASGEAEAHDLPGSASGLRWAPDGERYAVALAPTPLVDDSYTSRDVYIVDAEDGGVTAKLGSVGKLGEFAWSPDGERIAYIGSEDIHDPREGRLFVVPADGGERLELLPDYPGHVRQIGWEADNRIRYVGHRGLWSEYGTVAADEPRAPGPAPDSGPILRSMDGVGGKPGAAFVADTPAHPPEVYVITADGPARLTDSNPWLAGRTLGRQETMTYEARDGLEIEAVLIRPLQESGRHPLIVFAHGGPESHYSNGWMSNYSKPAHTMAARGYAIVYPNYRGSTGRGVAFSKMGQQDYADEEFNDLVDAKEAVVAMGLADPGRVGISGGSYGGYASMWAASALTEHFAAAVAFVGISNQISKFGTGDIPWEMYYVHSRQWPWDDWMWMLERSPVYHAGKTKTPLLIMAGDKDPRVHPGQSLEMYRNVKLRTDTPVRLVWYPDEVHGNRRTAAQLDYAMRFERWMNHFVKNLGDELPPWELDHAARLEAAAAD
jgi:dipeptidyl aminopeptidase/acylaminoacyl peptidase